MVAGGDALSAKGATYDSQGATRFALWVAQNQRQGRGI